MKLEHRRNTKVVNVCSWNGTTRIIIGVCKIKGEQKADNQDSAVAAVAVQNSMGKKEQERDKNRSMSRHRRKAALPMCREFESSEWGSLCMPMQGRHLCISTTGRMRWRIVQTFRSWFQDLFRTSCSRDKAWKRKQNGQEYM